MTQSYAQGSIAGVSLVDGDPCRCMILDGARLQSTRYVNQRISASGDVYTQGFSTGGRGAHFGVQLDSIPLAMFTAIVEAINDAIDAMSPFNITLVDDVHVINRDCTIDGSNWLNYPQQITNERFLNGVTMRFITVGDAESGS